MRAIYIDIEPNHSIIANRKPPATEVYRRNEGMRALYIDIEPNHSIIAKQGATGSRSIIESGHEGIIDTDMSLIAQL